MGRLPTVLVLGDQLSTSISSLAGRPAGSCRVLIVESESKLRSRPWHVQRAHLVLSAMAHFAQEIRSAGHLVDERRAPNLRVALESHRQDHDVSEIVAMEPASWRGRDHLLALGVTLTPNNQFLCHPDEFAAWAADRSRLRMEDFYRWQRRRLDVLMDGDEPCGGAWNYDADNRESPPRDGRPWPTITSWPLDEIDIDVLRRLEVLELKGAPPHGLWPVTRAQALTRLDEFVGHSLAIFGPHEDAMLSDQWRLAHSALSSALNLGLLHPREVIERVESAFRGGGVPINSAEGFIRQIVGWREYVWGVYWLWGPAYAESNFLEARRALPPAFTGRHSQMRCVTQVASGVHERGYAHHIERLMVLGNLALTAGVDPQAMTDWMRANFVDAAEWVMIPNVIGMALWADGGAMATKPYASGGAYLNRMSDHCRHCRYDPRQRTGDDACPFTTLYWNFLARNEPQLTGNHRMSRQLAAMRRLTDLDEVRARATEMLAALDADEL